MRGGSRRNKLRMCRINRGNALSLFCQQKALSSLTVDITPTRERAKEKGCLFFETAKTSPCCSQQVRTPHPEFAA